MIQYEVCLKPGDEVAVGVVHDCPVFSNLAIQLMKRSLLSLQVNTTQIDARFHSHFNNIHMTDD
jgi:hypothetical protein